jgi:asparagine synthase (glutamine-hydrolysing)
MCGIAGQYCLRPTATVSETVLRNHNEALQRRGPDDEGIWKNTIVGLCHRRLAILDPDGGHQPMVGTEGAILSYNGEIYNHQELRTELEARGHQFQTHSDPEVVLTAFAEWGEAAWKRFNGMFAFALWNPKDQSLHLVRDRLGIKPLFFSIRHGNLHFASEPSALLRCEDVGRDLEPAALMTYLLYFQPILGDQTLFRDIRMLEPGTEITVRKTDIQTKKWWEPQIKWQDSASDETLVRGKLRYLLQSAVHRQIAADVPVGAYLSGGLDSTILVGLWVQMTRETLPTYTICLEGDEDEADYATLAARRFGTRHKNYKIGAEEFFDGMRNLISMRRLPLSVPNEVLIYLLAERVAPEVKVVLTGEGADELFGGYYGLLSAVESQQISTQTLMDAPRPAEQAETLAREEGRYFASLYRWFSNEELRPLLSSPFAEQLDDLKIDGDIAECFKRLSQIPFLERALFFLEHFHLPSLLGRLDGATMAGSVEGRVPFTDSELVEFVEGLPGSLRFQGSLKPDKYLLRKTFEDLVPTPILQRPKKAFPVPLGHLFETPRGQIEMRRILECNALFTFVRREPLTRWLAEGRGPGFAFQVWKLLSLAMFLDENM